MKATFIAQLLILLVASPALGFGRAHAGPPAKLAILSDVDDTVRPTGVKHHGRAFKIAIGKKHVKAFSGMKVLYEQLLLAAGANPAKDEYFISGSPWTLSYALEPFLKANGFSTEHVQIRYFGPLRGIREFKQGQFDKIFRKNSKTPFILVGDDTEQDANAIAYAKEKYPNQVAGMYIHSVEGITPAFGEQVPYFTAVEIALHEMKKGRLGDDHVNTVAQATLDDVDFQWDVIPVYAKLCPEAGWISKIVADPQLSERVLERTKVKIRDIEKGVAAVCVPHRVPRDYETVEERD